MFERGFVRTLLAEFCIWLLRKLAWEVVVISKEVYDAKEALLPIVSELDGHPDFDGSTKFRHADRKTKYLYPLLTDAERMWAIDLAVLEIKDYAKFLAQHDRQKDAARGIAKGH